MTLDDFRALTDWLYPEGPGHAAHDMRTGDRSMRAWRSGRSRVPPTIAAYLVGRVALRLTLTGWRAELPPVSAEILAEIQNRLEEARRHAAQEA